jgi:hypothetical protein
MNLGDFQEIEPIYNLEFDHIDPKTKCFNITDCLSHKETDVLSFPMFQKKDISGFLIVW